MVFPEPTSHLTFTFPIPPCISLSKQLDVAELSCLVGLNHNIGVGPVLKELHNPLIKYSPLIKCKIWINNQLLIEVTADKTLGKTIQSNIKMLEKNIHLHIQKKDLIASSLTGSSKYHSCSPLKYISYFVVIHAPGENNQESCLYQYNCSTI